MEAAPRAGLGLGLSLSSWSFMFYEASHSQNISSHSNRTESIWISKGASKLLKWHPLSNEVENDLDDPKWLFHQLRGGRRARQCSQSCTNMTPTLCLPDIFVPVLMGINLFVSIVHSRIKLHNVSCLWFQNSPVSDPLIHLLLRNSITCLRQMSLTAPAKVFIKLLLLPRVSTLALSTGVLVTKQPPCCCQSKRRAAEPGAWSFSSLLCHQHPHRDALGAGCLWFCCSLVLSLLNCVSRAWMKHPAGVLLHGNPDLSSLCRDSPKCCG